MNPPSQRLADPLDEEDAVNADLSLLTRMAALVTGMPKAFVTFAETAHARGKEESFCARALEEEEMLVAEDVYADPRTRAIALRRRDATIVTYAGALIKTDDGRKLGTLCITDAVKRPLSETQLQLLRGLARQAMNLLSLRQAKLDLSAALAQMTRLATLDDLSGLLNRRAFLQEAERIRRLVARQQGGLCVAIVDIDHFKRVNDRHGHAAGDAVIKAVAHALRRGLRDSDVVGRIGGEEFAIVLPFTRAADALRRLQQLRVDVAALDVDGVRVTLSGGLTELVGARGAIDAALKHADTALYRAKASGRDRIELAACAEPLAA